MRKYTFIILVLLAFSLSAKVLTYEKVLKNRKGIQLYEKEKFEDSENTFQENAMQYPNEGVMHFNHGNSLFKDGKLEEAENAYQLALRDEGFSEKSKLYHNMGNVKFEQQDYKNALNYYRNAIMEDQNNADARYNYELAAQYLQRQQQQQQQDNEEQNASDYAKKMKEKARQLVAQRKYEEAYAVIQEALKKDETMKFFASFNKRVKNVAEIGG
jgi:tetratricopeptide (TPR) repeat protein